MSDEKTKWTPGPWVADFDALQGCVLVCTVNPQKYEAEDYEGTLALARVQQWASVPPRAEVEANARLMAAAPEMAEALVAQSRFERYAARMYPLDAYGKQLEREAFDKRAAAMEKAGVTP